MALTEHRAAVGVEVRRIIEDWSEALRSKDIDRLWSHYTSDIRSFDLAPPLQHGSELREALAAWFETWEGPIGFELRDLEIAAGSDLAFSHGLCRLSGKRTDGEVANLWHRGTLCFRRTDGGWKIAHEHSSVPFYMDGSYRAAVDLVP